MMSQIVMSIFSSPVPSGLGEASSFFETFVPRVWIYLSSKLSRTNRRMREVLPTAASPMRQTFTFILLTSINSRLALGIPGETRLNVMGALSSGIIDWPRGARPHRNVLRDGRMANDDVSSPKYGDRRWPDVRRIL